MEVDANKRRKESRVKTKSIKITIIIAAILLAFLTGRQSVGSGLFWKGYDAAMNHVRTTIETKAPELAPFYVADLGIKFIPRGGNILQVKYIGSDSPDTSTRVASAGGQR